MYNLEYLIKKFSNHHDQYIKENKKIITDFIENNPGIPLPKYMTDEFSFPLAMASICSEVLKIKEEKDGKDTR